MIMIKHHYLFISTLLQNNNMSVLVYDYILQL